MNKLFDLARSDKRRYGKQYGYEVLFKNQPEQVFGKAGVIIAESGMPEGYDFEYYANFSEHIFRYTLPPWLAPIVLIDKGKALIDPENPLAREPFKPQHLIDALGSFVNDAGEPYVKCDVKWVPPAVKKNPWDYGYFLYTGDGKNGVPDICDKAGAKIAGWYFGKLLPDKKVPWRSQMNKVYDEAVLELSTKYPSVEFHNANYMCPESMQRAVNALINTGCQTIIYQGINNPVYTDFDDYGFALVNLHEMVNGRTQVIMADQLGNQPPMRQAFLALLREQLEMLPLHASLLVILSMHGHPFKKETSDERAYLYREPLEAAVCQALAGRTKKWHVTWSEDDYADEYWDPYQAKLSTRDAFLLGIREGYNFILELPTDFPAENTDSMLLHAMKKYSVFTGYDRNQPIYYPDWDKPLVRTFREGKTTAINTGAPVGPFRRYVVAAVVASISRVLG